MEHQQSELMATIESNFLSDVQAILVASKIAILEEFEVIIRMCAASDFFQEFAANRDYFIARIMLAFNQKLDIEIHRKVVSEHFNWYLVDRDRIDYNYSSALNKAWDAILARKEALTLEAQLKDLTI